jgi:LysR family transcriptional regulator, regulator for bpeEF and oprC
MSASRSELFAGVLPFVVTAETRSFRQAAQRLALTPSGVSKAITRLEAELGTRLLNRTSRSVTLTEEGTLFLQACRVAVDQVSAARERLSAHQRAPRGTLVVSLPLILGRRVILPALHALLARHPALSIRAGLTDRFVRLSEENVDAAVRIGPKPDSRLVMRKLAQVRWKTVAAPGYLARRGTPSHPSQLGSHACLRFVLPHGVLMPWHFHGLDTRAQSINLSLGSSLCSDHGDALIDAAIAGHGIFQAHDYAVREALEHGELIELLPAFEARGPDIGLVFAPGKRRMPKVRAFAELVTQLLATPRTRAAPA